MRVIPEGKIVISVIESYCPEKIVIGNSHKEKQKSKKDDYAIWNVAFLKSYKIH
jgi:hypothetical protein